MVRRRLAPFAPRRLRLPPLGDVVEDQDDARVRPSSLRMGAALSSIGVSPPDFERSTVWLASPTGRPSRKTFAAGLSTVSRVSSLTTRKTSERSRPRASALDQPVNFSATALRKVTRPRSSVVMTASPMLLSVVASDSSLRRASASARWPCLVR